ncbi:22435_t:CDS:2 [Rhizophagus irregularis]|nr:22435_t:CDS:2 [Rhizophagus irregularis]
MAPKKKSKNATSKRLGGMVAEGSKQPITKIEVHLIQIKQELRKINL